MRVGLWSLRELVFGSRQGVFVAVWLGVCRVVEKWVLNARGVWWRRRGGKGAQEQFCGEANRVWEGDGLRDHVRSSGLLVRVVWSLRAGSCVSSMRNCSFRQLVPGSSCLLPLECPENRWPSLFCFRVSVLGCMCVFWVLFGCLPV